MAKLYSTNPAERKEIVLGESGIAAAEPVTVIQLLRSTRDAHPQANALAYKDGDQWKTISYAEYDALCVKVAKSFLKLGLQKYHSVSIIGFNSPEWFLSALGAIYAGGLACGLYTSSSPEACQYIINDSKSVIVVVEDDRQLQKILKVKNDLPYLKAIIQYKGKVTENYPDVYEWAKFIDLGNDMDDKVIEDAISAQTPSDCVSLIYTSGTTGDPKGVMITHDNLSWTTKIIHQMIGGDFTVGNKIVSYLPLSHIAGQLVDIFFSLSIGITIYFAQPDALKGSLGETLREVEPTLFLGVPRVWEKFMEKLSAMLPRPGSGPPPTPEMMQAIKAKVRAGLGLTKCKVMITAAAPTSMEVFNFFAKFGIDICEVWGMSELTGPGTTTTYSTFVPNYWKLGSIGKPYIGTEVKIDSPDPVTGEGEVCARGRHVMMGYLNKPEKTSETIDAEGWLHSGDIGKMDKDGFFYITGRMKEIIITSGGENIAPVPVEDAVKKNAPFLSNVILIGDKRKFISCLVTLKCDMNPLTGGPTDSLTAEAIQLISSLGSSSTKVSEVIDKKDEAVYAAIQKAIDTTNENAASHAQKIQKFTILKDDLSIPGGELGPTMKLKRFYVVKKYSEVIDQMYN